MKHVRLTAAQALVRYLAALRANTGLPGVGTAPLFGGVFAIFGHGNVAGVGEALYRHRAELPTYRAHNEQAMAHVAIAYAKAHMRRRMMACTTSIGPGATNLVTAAALAHVNRLPVLFLPGDIFASHAPDPVLQQVEDFDDANVSANDCLKPVSRYFDRIMRPEQLLTALPRAIATLTDPALCGPVTLALPQDVQTMAYDFPESFFAPAVVEFDAPSPDEGQLERATAILRKAKKPLAICGGGVLYGLATDALRAFAETHGVPVAETQAGKGALAVGPSAAAGRDRRYRIDGGQRAGTRRGCGARGRHAPDRFHHRFAFAVRSSEARASQRQRVRRAQVARRRAYRRREGGPRSAVAFAAGLALRDRLGSEGEEGSGRLARRGRAHHGPSATSSCRTRAR